MPNEISIENPQAPELSYPPLPAEHIVVNTYTISAPGSENTIELPLVVIPKKSTADETHYFYYLGWPKTFLSDALRDIAQERWDRMPKYEDEKNHYYYTHNHRSESEPIPKDMLNKQVSSDFNRAQEAFAFVTRAAKNS